MDPYTIPSNTVAESFDQGVSDRGYHSSAQAGSDQFFGVQNDNHYHQDVRRALHERSVNAQLERSVNAQYKAYALQTASAYEKITASQPESGPLEYPLASIPYLRGWSPSLEKEFRVFWHRVWRCTAFREYRTAPPKADRIAKEEDKKWTSLREEMFFRGMLVPDGSREAFAETDRTVAVVKFPPVGRQKDTYNSCRKRNREKQMGRNELLADSINEWLVLQDPEDHANVDIVIPVEDRALGRKQISSHLQVLKVKFREDPWSEYLILAVLRKADRLPSQSDVSWWRQEPQRPSTTSGTW